MKRTTFWILLLALGVLAAEACTSAIFAGRATTDGRPILWKHRDTGAEGNFIARTAARDGLHAFVALYNYGDSTLAEAWMGMNDAGFAVMNTASYNLAPDTAKVKDREGVVMKRALEVCRSLKDFENLLDTLPKPLGVQANFGVLDAGGHGAYYETDDYSWKRFAVDETPEGYIVRTNYSYSGEADGGYGYIREANARYHIERNPVTAELLTETVSRSFYHSLLGRDCSATTDRYIVDLDFVPRRSSTASVAIVDGRLMWANLGYPPAGVVYPVTLEEIPEAVQPDEKWRCPACDSALTLKAQIFPIRRGNGPQYIDVEALNRINAERRARSLRNYSEN